MKIYPEVIEKRIYVNTMYQWDVKIQCVCKHVYIYIPIIIVEIQIKFLIHTRPEFSPEAIHGYKQDRGLVKLSKGKQITFLAIDQKLLVNIISRLDRQDH